jgi:ubiquitin-protein ligase
VPKNRDYKYVDRIGTISVKNVITSALDCATDLELRNTMELLEYDFIKWCVETRTVRTEFNEFKINTNTTDEIVRQWHVLHDSITEARFAAVETCFLLHGSGIENWHSIIRNGIFNASKTKLMTAGAVHGNGVYLSDFIGLSSGYSRGELDGSRDMLMGVFQVMGKPEDWRKTSNIYVVPDASKLLLKYLIMMPRNGNLTQLARLSKDILAHYNRRNILTVKFDQKVNNRIRGRITHDLKKLTESGMTVRQDTGDQKYEIVVFTPTPLTLRLHYPPQYPFEPPIMFASRPIVSNPLILPSGAISCSLLAADWHVIYDPKKVIDMIVDAGTEFVTDGEYDRTVALTDALMLRGTARRA